MNIQQLKVFFFLSIIFLPYNVANATSIIRQEIRLKKQAYYPGGNRKLFNDAFRRRKLDFMCDWQGYLHITFQIDSKGIVKGASIPESICTDLKAKLLQGFINMPRWIPARNMLNKRVQSNVVVVFKWRIEN